MSVAEGAVTATNVRYQGRENLERKLQMTFARDQLPDLGTPDKAAGETAVLTVDLGAIRDNYALLASFAGKAECAAVVKADAYGTGVSAVAPALFQQGCRTFFVATLAEGVVLRQLLPEVAIYALNGYFEGSGDRFLNHRISPVLGSLEELESWTRVCRRTGEVPAAALHIDTGMNRLGVGPDEIGTLIDNQARLLSGIRIDLLMSHLACADEPHHERNRRQLKLFRKARAALPPMRTSLANSAGILLGADYHFDVVRPGIGLYGGQPTGTTANPMRAAVRLVSHIAQIRTVEAGDSVGYGATFTASRQTRIATVPVGYADGYPRTLGSGKGTHVVIAGQRAPLAGRVSMDLITVDVTDLPAHNLRVGAQVEVIGENITVDELAGIAGTISYEVLTSLGRRYRRHYSEIGS